MVDMAAVDKGPGGGPVDGGAGRRQERHRRVRQGMALCSFLKYVV